MIYYLFLVNCTYNKYSYFKIRLRASTDRDPAHMLCHNRLVSSKFETNQDMTTLSWHPHAMPSQKRRGATINISWFSPQVISTCANMLLSKIFHVSEMSVGREAKVVPQSGRQVQSALKRNVHNHRYRVGGSACRTWRWSPSSGFTQRAQRCSLADRAVCSRCCRCKSRRHFVLNMLGNGWAHFYLLYS